MIYIDFDGVILDTEDLLFDEWRKLPNREILSMDKRIEYIKNSDWDYILNNAEIINNSVDFLKNIDCNESIILTKIHSLENEGVAKVKWIRRSGIKQRVILVPYTLMKSDMVDAEDNILIDDCLKNLEDWENNGGIPIFFDYDDDNYDGWKEYNTKGYSRVLSLSKFVHK